MKVVIRYFDGLHEIVAFQHEGSAPGAIAITTVPSSATGHRAEEKREFVLRRFLRSGFPVYVERTVKPQEAA